MSNLIFWQVNLEKYTQPAQPSNCRYFVKLYTTSPNIQLILPTLILGKSIWKTIHNQPNHQTVVILKSIHNINFEKYAQPAQPTNWLFHFHIFAGYFGKMYHNWPNHPTDNAYFDFLPDLFGIGTTTSPTIKLIIDTFIFLQDISNNVPQLAQPSNW